MEILITADKELQNIEKKIVNLDSSLEISLDNAINNLSALKNTIYENQSLLTSKYLLPQHLSKLKEALLRASSDHKDIHSLISKFGKYIDKSFISNYYDACLDPNFESSSNIKIINEMICEHFFRHGICTIADTLIKESDIVLTKTKKEPFIELNHILQSLKDHDLQPAIKWANDHHDALVAKNSSIEFKLHRLNFLKILSTVNENDNASPSPLSSTKMALIYAAKKLTPFVGSQTKEFQHLMGCLLFQNPSNIMNHVRETFPDLAPPPINSLRDSPYKFLTENYLWEEIEDMFAKEACSLLGFSTESPLSISFACGVKAYPALLNIKQMMQQRHVTGVWNSHMRDELPVEVDLGPECRFHSIFACPILRQQSSQTNPPMRLKCGHVISREALNKLANVSKVKCPYCPEELAVSEAKQIYF